MIIEPAWRKKKEAASPRGKFLTFEGGEGAGKSTQVTRLANRLREHGISVVTTREPGGSPGAEAMRHVLLTGAAERLGAEAEAMLFAAARADHVDTLIKPALDRNDWVICDRFIDSTRVYQGLTGSVPARLITGLEAISVGATMPDLTLLLDIATETGLQRAAERRGLAAVDRFEKDGIDIQERRRDGFLALARSEPHRFVVIDAARDMETVSEAIWYAVKQRMGLERD